MPPETIMEVWYSARLSVDGASSKKGAAAWALWQDAVPGEVKHVLFAWATQDTSLRAAREAWYTSLGYDLFPTAMNLLNERVQISPLHYSAAGDSL